MNNSNSNGWEKLVVSPYDVLKNIRTGMSIFLSTGVAEPRKMVSELILASGLHYTDLELIQIFSIGEAIDFKDPAPNRYRLKTFFSGWIADEAVSSGRVDLIPGYFSQIPQLIKSGQISVDVAFIQISPPNQAGYCSLGVAMDAARQAMQQAHMVVGEINPNVPVTYGDTFVNIFDFNYLVRSTEPLIYFDRWEIDPVFDRVAANIASVIGDGSCVAFSIGPLFDALGKHLVHKRHLGIHTPFFTDALMDLCMSGAVSNRFKSIFQGKSLTSYALGTPKLMKWLDGNPLVEFQSVEKVLNPLMMGKNPRFITVIPGRKVDLSGMIAIHEGKSNVSMTPGEIINFTTGSRISNGGLTIFGLPSRNRAQEPNILMSIENYPNQIAARESVDMVVTEYGVANLKGRTMRERAQALIEIAHPDDRLNLIEQAKEKHILYQDQIFMVDSAAFYPADISEKCTFKNGLEVRFRAIRPSDEEQMRRLFYRFSSESIYYRYFTQVTSMPHSKMQKYVNTDYNKTLSIVGLIGDPGHGRIIAEARYVKLDDPTLGEVAFIVDEKYQKKGIATFLFRLLSQQAKEKGLEIFTADVLSSNTAMMRVFKKFGATNIALEYGTYSIEIKIEELFKKSA